MHLLTVFVCCVLALASSYDGDEYDIETRIEEVRLNQQGNRNEIAELRDNVLAALKLRIGEMLVQVHKTMSGESKTSTKSKKEFKNEEEEVIDIVTEDEVSIEHISSDKYPVFYAERSSPFKSTGSFVNYDSTSVNIGNGLNQTTGVFTAPVTGIYVLYFSACKAQASQDMIIRVMHNNKAVNSRRVSKIDQVTNIPWITLESQVILPLNAGDKVAVKLQSGAIYDDKLAVHTGKMTTFSGFLLQGPMSNSELMSFLE